ncbi:MAG: hypothetical protein IJ088_14300 [Clostridia bacterium]|nr:hypothetical protein [Clostridia bacterium]
MAQATMQQKPQEKQSGAGNGRKAGNTDKVKKTLPVAPGVVIMVLLLVVSLFVGNMRALQNVTPASFLKTGNVSSIVEDRASAAQNAETVARRASLDESLYQAVDSAVKEFRSAKTARDLSRADQDLTAAVSEMTAEAKQGLDTENQRVLTRAIDSFTEQGSFLRQEGRAFNEKANKAIALYEKLPTAFLLPRPDRYEGLE